LIDQDLRQGPGDHPDVRRVADGRYNAITDVRPRFDLGRAPGCFTAAAHATVTDQRREPAPRQVVATPVYAQGDGSLYDEHGKSMAGVPDTEFEAGIGGVTVPSGRTN
jgi:hypothetical protein